MLGSEQVLQLPGAGLGGGHALLELGDGLAPAGPQHAEDDRRGRGRHGHDLHPALPGAARALLGQAGDGRGLAGPGRGLGGDTLPDRVQRARRRRHRDQAHDQRGRRFFVLAYQRSNLARVHAQRVQLLDFLGRGCAGRAQRSQLLGAFVIEGAHIILSLCTGASTVRSVFMAPRMRDLTVPTGSASRSAISLCERPSK